MYQGSYDRKKVWWRKTSSTLISLLVLSALLINNGLAQPSVEKLVTSTQESNTILIETYEQALKWGLSSDEWGRYREVMASKRGVWSPGLDPISALGVSANSISERRRFAELYVRAEFERVRKELAFQVEVDSAWKRLYPNTPRLLDVARAKPDTRPTQRYAVVVARDCTSCKDVVLNHLQIQSSSDSGNPVDVHVVGTTGDDAELRAWVSRNRWIEPALKENRVTLNHGSDFADLSQFPVVFAKKEGGQWEREL